MTVTTYYQNERGRTTETLYKGQRFVSALAARWAVFLDALHVPYKYQAQFWPPLFQLPEQACRMLTLGRKPTPAEQHLAAQLAERGQHPVYLFVGEMQVPVLAKRFERYLHASRLSPDQQQDDGYAWCECPRCGALGITFKGWTEHLACSCLHEVQTSNLASPLLLGAYLTAVQTRFDRSGRQRKDPIIQQFAPGDMVQHRLYGMGMVLASTVDDSQELVEVSFADGTKTLDVAFARLEKM